MDVTEEKEQFSKMASELQSRLQVKVLHQTIPVVTIQYKKIMSQSHNDDIFSLQHSHPADKYQFIFLLLLSSLTIMTAGICLNVLIVQQKSLWPESVNHTGLFWNYLKPCVYIKIDMQK